MGYDTRFWGPSAWQLFHLIAFFSPNPQEFLLSIKDVLPCKYCRASTAEFTSDMGPCKDPGRWLYDLHNMVNGKLRTQAKEDPVVINPGPDPSFEEVKTRYEAIIQSKPTAVPGRDFLFVIASNHGDADVPDDYVQTLHRMFWKRLAQVYPFEDLRAIVKSYVDKHPPRVENRAVYMRWVYGLLVKLSKKVKAPIMSYNGYAQHVAYYKSGCQKKTYKGKTCRKLGGGGYTKNRDHKKTRRISHRNLL